MTEEGFQTEQVIFRRFFSMRYRRQTADVEIPLPWEQFSGELLAKLQMIFEEKYEELYGVGAGYTKAGIEISAIRVDAVGVVAKPKLKSHDRKKSDSSEAIKGRREIFFTGSVKKFIDTRVYDYALLGAGNEIAGPAVIELPFTTTLVPPGFRVIIDDYLNLLMEML